MDKLIENCQPNIHAEITKVKNYEELVKNSEVIATATPISHKPEPQIKDEWVGKGKTFLLCDCHSLVEDKTVKRANKYILDSIEQHSVLEKYGYYPEGLPEVYAETGEIVAGIKKGRENNEELIVVNNVGMAVEDIMIARSIFDKSLQKGIGVKLPLWKRTT